MISFQGNQPGNLIDVTLEKCNYCTYSLCLLSAASPPVRYESISEIMSRLHFQLLRVQAKPGACLRLEYADGQTFEVDLQGWIQTTEALKPLKDPALFAAARIGFGGRSVEWIEDELDLGADNLRNLAVEQAGGIGHERIWNWLHENNLTLEAGAAALGISRRMLIYYRDGEKPIPRTIWLACLGWEAVRPQGAFLPERIPSL